MVKLLLIELIKFYVTTPVVKEKKRYSNYFIGTFIGIALILLILVDFIYIFDEVGYMIYMKDLLMVSTFFLVAAGIVKLLSLWVHRQARLEELSGMDGLPRVIKELLPVVVSMIPLSLVAYVIWAKIQVKFFGRTVQWKSTVKRLLW